MRNMLYIIWGSLCLLLVISGCKSTDGAKAPVSLTWKMGAVEVQPGYYENSFVLKNISDVPLGKDWIIYYSQLPREILQEESAPVKVEVVENFLPDVSGRKFSTTGSGRFVDRQILLYQRIEKNVTCSRRHLLGESVRQ